MSSEGSGHHLGPEVDEADWLEAAQADVVERLEVGGFGGELALDGVEAAAHVFAVVGELLALELGEDAGEAELAVLGEGVLDGLALGGEELAELGGLELAAAAQLGLGLAGALVGLVADERPEGGEVVVGAAQDVLLAKARVKRRT